MIHLRKTRPHEPHFGFLPFSNCWGGMLFLFRRVLVVQLGPR